MYYDIGVQCGDASTCICNINMKMSNFVASYPGPHTHTQGHTHIPRATHTYPGPHTHTQGHTHIPRATHTYPGPHTHTQGHTHIGPHTHDISRSLGKKLYSIVTRLVACIFFLQITMKQCMLLYKLEFSSVQPYNVPQTTYPPPPPPPPPTPPSSPTPPSTYVALAGPVL